MATTAGALLLAAALSGPAAAQNCLSPGAAREAVQSGDAVPLSQLRRKIASEAGGEVISAQLCRSDGRYVYLVNVLSSRGR